MNKPNKPLENFLREKRERKFNKRKLSWKPYVSDFSVVEKEKDFRFDHDKKVINHSYFPLNDFLYQNGFYQKASPIPKIEFPKCFSLKHNYEESILCIQRTAASLMRYAGKEISFDFSKCEKIDFAALCLLGVLIREYYDFFQKLENKLLITKTTSLIKITQSKNSNVNILLLITQFLPEANGEEKVEFIPVFSLGFFKGRKIDTHYLKNQKGPATTRTLAFVNECLLKHGYALNTQGVNSLGGIISEVLNNAEDHGLSGDWYISAAFLQSKEEENSEIVGELNLAIINFGDSFFAGFEKTKNENLEVYDQMNDLYNIVQAKCPIQTFTKENLFTLYALQDGFSRLKYENDSRGTGTMKFINSFLEIGDYEDLERNFNPYLMIISGKTKIISTIEFKPFKYNENFYMSLNPEQDLTIPPIVANLNKLDLQFPGTILSVKIYLNSKHLQAKYENGAKEN